MPSAPVMVLTGPVVLYELAARFQPEQKWKRIKCASQVANGCGEKGQAVVEGITLYRSVGDYPPHLTVSLCFTVSDDAFRGIEVELRARNKHLDETSSRRHDFHVQGEIKVADDRLMVLAVRFRLLRGSDELSYYLVYDSRAASLSMIPALPEHRCQATYTMTPVLVSVGAHGGEDYELALLARKTGGQEGRIDQDVLCLCTGRDARSSPASSARPDGIGPWETMPRRFPGKVHDPFTADVMFSLEGRAFWTDLYQGLVHCDLRTTCGSGGVHDFGFIGLPKGYRVDYVDQMDEEMDPAKMSRTVGCLGSKICFVSIDRPDGAYGDDAVVVVTMWTMELPGEETWSGKWRRERRLTAKQLWEVEGFEEVGLPQVAPEYPVLMPDGAICFLLRAARDVEEVDSVSSSSFDTRSESLQLDQDLDEYVSQDDEDPDQEEEEDTSGCDGDSESLPWVNDPVEDYICCVDMSSKTLRWHGRVQDYGPITDYVVVRSKFFKSRRASRKRKLPDASSRC